MMIIRNITTLILLLVITNNVISQSFAWVNSAPVAYSLNPACVTNYESFGTN